MCKMIFCDYKSRKLLTSDYLDYATQYNPDGLGCTICYDRQLITKRNIDNKDLASIISREFEYIVCHWRLATSGYGLDMIHPHAFGGDSKGKYLLYHNGVIGELNNKSEVKSDTRLFADLLGSNEFDISSHGPLIDLFCKVTGNKMIILSQGMRPFIANGRAGLWTNGLWDSNKDNPLDITGYGDYFFEEEEKTTKSIFREFWRIGGVL